MLRKHVNAILLGLWGLMLAYAVVDRGGINLVPHLLEVGVVYLMVLMWLQAREFKSNYRWLYYLLGGFILMVVLSAIFGLVKGQGIFEVLAFVSGPLLFFVFSQRKFTPRQIEKMMKFIFGLGLVVVILGFWGYLNEPFRRLAGTFRNYGVNYSFFPNACANFLLMLGPIAVYFWFKAKSRRQELLRAAGLIFGLAALWLTFSRGAYLMLLVGVVAGGIYLIYKNRHQERGKLKLGLKLLAILVLSLVVARQVNIWRLDNFETISVQEKATLQADEGVSSVRERLDFWDGSLRLIGDNFWLGSGPGSFQYVYPRYQKELLALSAHPHNWFLKVGVENGVLGMLCLFGFLIGVAWFLGRDWRTLTVVKRRLVLVFLASAVLGLGHNLIDYNFNFVANMGLWWGVLGMMMAVLGEKKEAVKRLGWNGKMILAGVLLLSIGVFIVALHETYRAYNFRKGRGLISAENYQAAEQNLERARGSIFPRNLYFELAEVYEWGYKRTRERDYLGRQKWALVKGLELNPKDAFLWDELGRFTLREEHQAEEAKGYFEEALRLDSLNSLEFHLDWVRAVELVDSGAIGEELAVKQVLLEDFLGKLRQNAHLTVLSGNPEAAMDLAKVLAEVARVNKNYDLMHKFKRLEEELVEVYWAEREKFEELYGEGHFGD